MNYTREQLREKFNTLPEALQEAIFSVETADEMMKIEKKNGLTIEQTGKLASITGLVMLGLLAMKDYVAEIEKELGVEREKASAVADDVNLAIFIKIRDLIQQAATNIKAYEPKPESGEASKNLFEQKMGQLFRIPREEVDLDGKKRGPDPYLEQV